MNLMDDLDEAHSAKSTTLVNEDGWCIKVIEKYGMSNNFKRYYITHAHEGYSWPVTKTNVFKKEQPMYQTVTCSQCNKIVPTKTLGFLELLKWEIV